MDISTDIGRLDSLINSCMKELEDYLQRLPTAAPTESGTWSQRQYLTIGRLPQVRENMILLRDWLLEHQDANPELDNIRTFLYEMLGTCYMEELTSSGWNKINESLLMQSAYVLYQYFQFETITTLIPPARATDIDSNFTFLLARYQKHRFNQGLKRSTQINSNYQLHNFIEWMKLNRFTLKDVSPKLLYEFYLSEHLTLATQYVMGNALRPFFKFLFSQRYTQFDLSCCVPKSSYISLKAHSPEILSVDQLKELLSLPERSSNVGKRDYAVLLLLVAYGLRPKDIAELKFEYIDFPRRTISLEQSKTGRDNNLYMPDEVLNALIEYLDIRPRNTKCPYVFIFLRNTIPELVKPITPDFIYRMVVGYASQLKQLKVTPRMLRATLATRVLLNGTDYNTVRAILGHSNAESTKHYIKIDLITLAKCVLPMPLLSSSSLYNSGGTKDE